MESDTDPELIDITEDMFTAKDFEFSDTTFDFELRSDCNKCESESLPELFPELNQLNDTEDENGVNQSEPSATIQRHNYLFTFIQNLLIVYRKCVKSNLSTTDSSKSFIELHENLKKVILDLFDKRINSLLPDYLIDNYRKILIDWIDSDRHFFYNCFDKEYQRFEQLFKDSIVYFKTGIKFRFTSNLKTLFGVSFNSSLISEEIELFRELTVIRFMALLFSNKPIDREICDQLKHDLTIEAKKFKDFLKFNDQFVISINETFFKPNFFTNNLMNAIKGHFRDEFKSRLIVFDDQELVNILLSLLENSFGSQDYCYEPFVRLPALIHNTEGMNLNLS